MLGGISDDLLPTNGLTSICFSGLALLESLGSLISFVIAGAPSEKSWCS
jgi:hypothetical protein